MREKLLKKLDELEKTYIEFWGEICSIESPTECKEGVDAVGKYIIDKAREKNWQIEIQPQEFSGDAICITMNPDSNEKPICFSAHMDTVHPIGLFGYPPVRYDEEYIYGPGTSDCKGGLTSSFMAMAALDEIGFTKRPVKLILQSDEENSSRNSNKTTTAFMCEKAKDAIAFLNCEGYSKGKIVCQRKGIRKYKFEITGKACHSARCYDGSSAILEAAHKIMELEKFKSEDGITCNCGLIEGGTAENTVPEKCTFTADIRFKTDEQMEEAKRFAEEIAAKSFVEGTSCALTLVSWRYPMEIKEKNLELLNKINEIFEANGIPKHEFNMSNGGSDAADITHYGIPCVDNFGTIGLYEHSIRECAKLSSLKESAKLLSLIALNI
jgi:glutamate carboxypeptidase